MKSEKEKDAAKETFNTTAFAQLLIGPGGWEAGAILLPLGIPWDDRNCTKDAVDPADELQAPIASIQANDTRTKLIEVNCPHQERTSERGIMAIGWGEEEKDWQTGAATKEGMYAIAA
ncbi:MAG TPA: hypothetical protein VF043_37430 [Ktedonobacteraceae bacterium]